MANDTPRHRMHVRLTDRQLEQLHEAALREWRTANLELQRVMELGFAAAYGAPVPDELAQAVAAVEVRGD